MPLGEALRADARRIAEKCLERLENALEDDEIDVKEMITLSKEIRAMREMIEALDPPVQTTFRLILEVREVKTAKMGN